MSEILRTIDALIAGQELALAAYPTCEPPEIRGILTGLHAARGVVRALEGNAPTAPMMGIEATAFEGVAGDAESLGMARAAVASGVEGA